MRVSRSTKRLRWALLLVGVAVLCLTVYTGYQASEAKKALNDTADNFETLGRQLVAGDDKGARNTLLVAQANAQAARENTSGLGWWLTSKLPGVGDDVDAVRTVADVVDQLAQNVLPQVVDAGEALDADRLRPTNGRIDLEPIEAIAPDVIAADRELGAQYARVLALGTSDLAPPIAAPVTLLQERLGDAASLSDRAARAVQLLPPMLGADEKRTYLFLFQSNAELRATGGLPGAFATITANNGKVTLKDQSAPGVIGVFDEPPAPLTTEETEVFGEQMGLYIQDANFTPHFPRAAELTKAMWEARGRESIDGVVATDPVALAHLLDGTGPVELKDGSELTGASAAEQLLNGAYAQIPDPAAQDAYFASVAHSIFTAFAGGQGDPQAVLEGLARSTAERRLLIWSDVPTEQQLLEGTRLAGELADAPSSAPEIGVYFNDAQASKMDYYLNYETTVTSTRCQAERQYLTVEVDLKSTAPDDVASLPDSVTGDLSARVPRGHIQVTTYFYAPVDGYVTDVLVDGQARVFNDDVVHQGRTVVPQTIRLAPGENTKLSFSVVGGQGQIDTPRLSVTPGASSTGIGAVSDSACS